MSGTRWLKLAGFLAALSVQGEDLSPTFLKDHGPALERLVHSLDPGMPGMAAIRMDWDAGREQEALRQLDSIFSGIRRDTGVLEPLGFPEDLEEAAEAALEDRFRILDRWETVPRLSGGGLDWHHRGSRNDKETAWMLNRHAFLPLLAEAHRRTGDARFRAQANRLIQDWLTANPYPDRYTFSGPWRPLEAARRILHAWVHVWFDYRVLDKETRLLMLASLPDHADALHQHASFWGGNHLITEKLGLLTLAYAWPEFAQSGLWQQDAERELSGQILGQTYPDGSFKELSNHYQRVVLLNGQYFLRLLAQLDPEYRDRPVAARMEAMWDFFTRVMRPDGEGPLNNASDREFNAGFVLNVWESYQRPDWRYIATQGREGTPPGFAPSARFPWAGQVILRDHWGPQADWVYFDAGPYGTAHQHVDRLHVSAALDGRPLLVDTGRYTYRPGRWKTYFQGPEGHNTLMLDGQAAEQAPREVDQPLPVAFQRGDRFHLTGAMARFRTPGLSGLFQSPVPWHRAVLYDERGFLLVFDHLMASGKHRLQANWHFDPEVEPATAEKALRPATGSPLKGSIREGAYSPDYNVRLPAPWLQFAGSLSGPHTFAWVLQDPAAPALSLVLESPVNAPEAVFSVIRAGQRIAGGTLQLHPEIRLVRYDILGGD